MSCFFGVLAIAWLYRFAADAVNWRTAIGAALLMSTSVFVILYFHDIRMYTMLIWLGIVHSWLYWRLAQRFRAARLTWLLFVVTASVLLYIHNFSTILFAGLGIHHLIFVNRSRRWWRIIAGWALGALFFLPYAPFVVAGLRFNSGTYNNLAHNPRSGRAIRLSDGQWLHLVVAAGFTNNRICNVAAARTRNPAVDDCRPVYGGGNFDDKLAVQYHNHNATAVLPHSMVCHSDIVRLWHYVDALLAYCNGGVLVVMVCGGLSV